MSRLTWNPPQFLAGGGGVGRPKRGSSDRPCTAWGYDDSGGFYSWNCGGGGGVLPNSPERPDWWDANAERDSRGARGKGGDYGLVVRGRGKGGKGGKNL